ncbi:hypothetical protein ACFLYJ_00635 [Candidatus Cloacimonadota bacterium]
MGKLVIIVILVVTAVFGTIGISINNRKVETPELVSTSLSHIKAKNLSNEGLHYAIKQINQGRINWDMDEDDDSNGNGNGNGNNTVTTSSQNEILQVFSNFDVLLGTIDSIRYSMNSTQDTLTIISYASSMVNGEYKQFNSTAYARYTAGSTGKAFNCSKTVTMQGNAVINGGKEENAALDFTATFGMSMADMKSIADNYYKNPNNKISPINGITYVELTGTKKLQMSGNWSGSGILIVDGNFKDTGKADFDGVIWVDDGYFQMTGQSEINGAVYVNSNDTVKLAGNAEVNYDETIVTDLLGEQSAASTSTSVEIISWDN